jgi:hypothetical protein
MGFLKKATHQIHHTTNQIKDLPESSAFTGKLPDLPKMPEISIPKMPEIPIPKMPEIPRADNIKLPSFTSSNKVSSVVRDTTPSPIASYDDSSYVTSSSNTSTTVVVIGIAAALMLISRSK